MGSNFLQVPIVLAHGVRSPLWCPSSTTRRSVASKDWRIEVVALHWTGWAPW